MTWVEDHAIKPCRNHTDKIGYFVRFARATVDLPGPGETTIRANAGNVHTGIGFRFRF